MLFLSYLQVNVRSYECFRKESLRNDIELLRFVFGKDCTGSIGMWKRMRGDGWPRDEMKRGDQHQVICLPTPQNFMSQFSLSLWFSDGEMPHSSCVPNYCDVLQQSIRTANGILGHFCLKIYDNADHLQQSSSRLKKSSCGNCTSVAVLFFFFLVTHWDWSEKEQVVRMECV